MVNNLSTYHHLLPRPDCCLAAERQQTAASRTRRFISHAVSVVTTSPTPILKKARKRTESFGGCLYELFDTLVPMGTRLIETVQHERVCQDWRGCTRGGVAFLEDRLPPPVLQHSRSFGRASCVVTYFIKYPSENLLPLWVTCIFLWISGFHFWWKCRQFRHLNLNCTWRLKEEFALGQSRGNFV